MSEEKKRIRPIIDGIFPAKEGAIPEYLVGTECKNCQKISFPQKVICPYCKSSELEEMRLSGKGSIYSYTICRMPLEKIKAPYAIGYVDMDEGVRVFAHFSQWSEDNLKIGARVEAIIEKFRETDEEEIWTYKFKIVDTDCHSEPGRRRI